MKTPDEIKSGLECQGSSPVRCSYCAYDVSNCVYSVGKDALAYIQQLETDACNWEIEATLYKRQIEQLKRERDAAVADIPRACGYCKHLLGYDHFPGCENWVCRNISGINTGWEWRGVKEPCTGASDGCTGASGV